MVRAARTGLAVAESAAPVCRRALRCASGRSCAITNDRSRNLLCPCAAIHQLLFAPRNFSSRRNSPGKRKRRDTRKTGNTKRSVLSACIRGSVFSSLSVRVFRVFRGSLLLASREPLSHAPLSNWQKHLGQKYSRLRGSSGKSADTLPDTLGAGLFFCPRCFCFLSVHLLVAAPGRAKLSAFLFFVVARYANNLRGRQRFRRLLIQNLLHINELIRRQHGPAQALPGAEPGFVGRRMARDLSGLIAPDEL